MSWRHYHYGLTHIAREQLRQQLRNAQAYRMANTDQEAWLSYQSDLSTLTEAPHG